MKVNGRSADMFLKQDVRQRAEFPAPALGFPIMYAAWRFIRPENQNETPVHGHLRSVSPQA
jgi:hypothetical protein